LLIVFIIAINSFCKLKSEAQNETSNESLPEEKNIVETLVLEKQDFTREIISNGKLAAILKAELYFKNPGIIETVKVHNGESVLAKTELAHLQNDDYQFSLEKAQVTMEKAEIDRLPC
jgi:membrane fusion protein (multidrug efflux system)